MSHRTAAAEIVEQTALALSELGRRHFIGEVHIAGAAGLGKTLKEGLWPLKFIEREVAAASGRDRNHDLCDPIRMRRATRNVDHGQPGFRFVIDAEKSTVL